MQFWQRYEGSWCRSSVEQQPGACQLSTTWGKCKNDGWRLESKTIIVISLLSFYSVRGPHQFKALCCSSTTSKFSFPFNCSSQSTQLQPLARSLSCGFFSFIFNVKSLSNCRLCQLPHSHRLRSTPALLVPRAVFSEVPHNRSSLPLCSYLSEHLFSLHFPTVGCDRATLLDW